MILNRSTASRSRALTVFVLTGALFVAVSSLVEGHPSDGPGEARLTGAWTVQVTLRDCSTGAPAGPSFNSLVTFHGDGTISETAGSLAFAPGQRSPGHGDWTRIGRYTYRQRMVALVLFDTPANLPGTPTFDPSLPTGPGFFAGWSVVTHTLTLTDANHAVSAGGNEFYKANGELYRRGCSSATALRFE
jgi:hypothetical protein